MNETATDFLGQTYTIGDYVVYATTSGRSPVQKLARVEKITRETKTRRVWTREIAGGSRLETHEVLKVGVREISNGRGFRRVTYPVPANIVKVPWND